MASISQGLVLTTAMVVSSTVLYLAFSKQKNSPPFQIPRTSNSNSHHPNKQFLRSCLYSEEKKRERKKKKKRVKFAENVLVKEVMRESNTNEEISEEQRKQNRVSTNKCRNKIMEIRGMPANRIALYNGILRDRGQRMACCH